MADRGAATEREQLLSRLRTVIEWVSERDHGKAVELDEVVHLIEADTIARFATLQGMTVEEGAAVLKVGPPRKLVIAWVHAAREWLGAAPNYTETSVEFPSVSMEITAAGEVERYAFTLQRVGKLTPHEARAQAVAERDALRAENEGLWREITRLREVNAELRSTPDRPVPPPYTTQRVATPDVITDGTL